MKSLRDARQILRSSPMQKGVNFKELGSLCIALIGAALRASTSQVNAFRASLAIKFEAPEFQVIRLE
ncbi:hypothetical protein [Roseateles albus]|uniref:Uncharacterized protein n=1 Tax=Roseateles albus TaxID=2987525 RepID=A0ABT5KDT2_9BURK|nr:hypothetical protein [Roseateles albus]MDC8772089.1 hypothetical protein [Roseateles albus]